MRALRQWRSSLLAAADGGSAAGVEQLAGGLQHQFGDDRLGLGRFDLGGDIGLLLRLRVAYEARQVGALGRFGGAQGGRLGGVDARGDAPDHLLHLGILADSRGIAVAVDTGPPAHLGGDVAQGGAAGAGQHREQDQLVERGLVLEAAGEVDEVLFLHLGILEQRRAAAGGALAEAVPVVALAHAGLVGADRRDHIGAGVVALGIQIDPVGEEAAGAVVLAAVHHPATVVLARDAGEHFAQPYRTDLGPGAADQVALDEAPQPTVAARAGLGIETVLDEGEVAAQGLGDVGVGLGQFDQQLNQLRQRGAGAAVLARHAHGAEAGLLEPGDRLVGQFALPFALDGAFGDAREDRSETLGEQFVVGAFGETGGGGFGMDAGVHADSW